MASTKMTLMSANEKSGYMRGNTISGSTISIKVW